MDILLLFIETKNMHMTSSPKKSKIKSKLSKKSSLLNSPFIGMYKADQGFKEKPAREIATELREKAWYGK